MLWFCHLENVRVLDVLGEHCSTLQTAGSILRTACAVKSCSLLLPPVDQARSTGPPRQTRDFDSRCKSKRHLTLVLCSGFVPICTVQLFLRLAFKHTQRTYSDSYCIQHTMIILSCTLVAMLMARRCKKSFWFQQHRFPLWWPASMMICQSRRLRARYLPVLMSVLSSSRRTAWRLDLDQKMLEVLKFLRWMMWVFNTSWVS